MKGTATEAAANVLGSGKKRKLKAHAVNVKRGHEGGYVVTNHMRDEEGYGSEEHTYPMTSFDDLVSHLKSHMGEESKEIAKGKSKKNTPGVKGMNPGDLE